MVGQYAETAARRTGIVQLGLYLAIFGVYPKAAGYRIYLCSNATSALHTYFPRIPGAEHFDGILVSADWKLLKPQHEIFELLYETFSLDPAECWFIDDHPPNIDGAIVTGMNGTVFDGDLKRLRRDLHAAGINVAEA